jgi:hypothetical protein
MANAYNSASQKHGTFEIFVEGTSDGTLDADCKVVRLEQSMMATPTLAGVAAVETTGPNCIVTLTFGTEVLDLVGAYVISWDQALTPTILPSTSVTFASNVVTITTEAAYNASATVFSLYGIVTVLGN